MTTLFVLFIISTVMLLIIGIYSLVVTRHLIRILLSVEILTKAVTLMMVAAGYLTGKMAEAQAYIISIIVIEVMLLVIATGIVYSVYKNDGTLDTKTINNLKG